MNTVVDASVQDPAALRAALAQARAQGLRTKDAAESLGSSEGAAVAAHVGVHEHAMQVQALKPEWFALLSALQPCGTLMALTRNDAVVHEKDGG